MDIRQIKKLSKIITVPISLAVALSGISAFAKTSQTGDFEITSSGSISAKNGEEITIDVYYPDGAAWIDLAGDASTSGGAHPRRTQIIANGVHRDRIERGELRQNMPPLLMDLSRQRLQPAGESQ